MFCQCECECRARSYDLDHTSHTVLRYTRRVFNLFVSVAAAVVAVVLSRQKKRARFSAHEPLVLARAYTRFDTLMRIRYYKKVIGI